MDLSGAGAQPDAADSDAREDEGIVANEEVDVDVETIDVPPATSTASGQVDDDIPDLSTRAPLQVSPAVVAAAEVTARHRTFTNLLVMKTRLAMESLLDQCLLCRVIDSKIDRRHSANTCQHARSCSRCFQDSHWEDECPVQLSSIARKDLDCGFCGLPGTAAGAQVHEGSLQYK